MQNIGKHSLHALLGVLFCFLTTTVRAQAPVGVVLSEEARSVAQAVSDSFGAPVEAIEAFIVEALLLQKDEGVPAIAVVGIAILESAGFTSYIYRNSGNPFGMKATPEWKGPVFEIWHEEGNTNFRKYKSPRSAVRDFSKLVRSRRWFADALQCPSGNYGCFIDKLSRSAKQPGFSADYEWPNKVKRVIATYNLDAITSEADERLFSSKTAGGKPLSK
jgi:flagellum-specific peptidoglycan hydrolase FlgJ